MKNIIFKATGLTLIELIVTSMLVSVVLFGLFSVTNVLSNNSQDYGQRYLLASQTQATLNHILGNVALAVGSVGANTAIVLNAGGDPNSFCVHQGPNSNILNNAPEDIWLCYSFSGYQINWCAENYPGLPASCSVASGLGHLVAGTSIMFVGTAYSMGPPAYANPTFSVTIKNCLNDSATCFSSPDPVNNPQVARTGSVATVQVGQ